LKNSYPIILISLCCILAFSATSSANQYSKAPDKKVTTKKQKYNTKLKCDGRQHCSQMKSYAEAKYFIEHCPNTKMDGDNDGIPCERQFNKGR
jgi:hypothetical protein